MSGGFFDYDQYRISRIADEVEQLIRNNDDQTLDEWGSPTGRNYPDKVIQQFQRGLEVLRQAQVYAQRIDWLVSGDDGEDSFLQRLQEDLDNLKDQN